MQDFDVIPTPGTYSVIVMQYLELNGAITLDFTPSANVEQILMQFSEAFHEQPSLQNTSYIIPGCLLITLRVLYYLMTYKEWRDCLFSFKYTMPLRPTSFGVPRGSWCSFCISYIITC
jgi:hypothetical protein